jgi:V/A-type H+/Na+-transporting ATPase subunit C
MPQGYGYGNARLRAMRSRLLTEADYNALLVKADIEEVITALTETPYRDDIEAALVRVDGVRCVFEALRTNLTRTLRHVREFFEGEPRMLVDLLLRRWDRHNVSTILRGQSREASPEEVLSAILPLGQLDEVALRELVHQPDLRAVMDLMTTWRLPYAGVLRGVQARGGLGPDLDQLELALYRFHYASMREALDQKDGNRAVVLETLQIEVDLINLSTALRLARWPDTIRVVHARYHATDVRPLLIEPGGYVSSQRLADLVARGGGPEGIVNGLSDTRYGPPLDAGWRRYLAGEDRLASLERELERWQAQCVVAMFTRDPLSIAIPIGYFGCKEIEVTNLRLIAQAVSLALNREQVRRDLIVVK